MRFRVGDRVAIPGSDQLYYLIGEVIEKPRWGRYREGYTWVRFGDEVPSCVRDDMLMKLPPTHNDHPLTSVIYSDGVPRCGHCSHNLFRVMRNGSELREPALRARAI